MGELLGIPYGEVTQAGMFPVAYTIGTDFRPGARRASDDAVHWNRWWQRPSRPRSGRG